MGIPIDGGVPQKMDGVDYVMEHPNLKTRGTPPIQEMRRDIHGDMGMKCDWTVAIDEMP